MIVTDSLNRITRPRKIKDFLIYDALAYGAILFSALFFSSTAIARQSLDNALFTGPLIAPSPTVLPSGKFEFQPYIFDNIKTGRFDKNGNHQDTPDTQTLTSLMVFEWGLPADFGIAIEPTFNYQLPKNGHSSNGLQLGDVALSLRYQLADYRKGEWYHPEIALALGENVPIGRYDGLSNQANGFGTGVYSTSFSIRAETFVWIPTGRIALIRGALSYSVPDSNAMVNGRSVYGSGENFHGEIHPSESFTSNLSFSYSLTHHWGAVIEGEYGYSSNAELVGTNRTHASSAEAAETGTLSQFKPVRTSTGPSQFFKVAPAVEYNWNKHFGVIGGASVVVAGKNTAQEISPQLAFVYVQ